MAVLELLVRWKTHLTGGNRMEQVISLVGAILILAAYAGHQFGLIEHTDAAYSWMNLVGSLVLAVVAYRGQQWGFLLLEVVWAAVSLVPLVRPQPSLPPQ
jgi:hypothetical protein